MRLSIKGPYVSDKEIMMLKSKKLMYAAVGICMILAGVFYFLHISSNNDKTEYLYCDAESDSADISFENGNAVTDGSENAAETEAQTLCVYVCGDVKVPGIYYCNTGSRVADAVEAAGGAGEDAYVESLNLAEQITDGQKIYIPREGETFSDVVTGQAASDSERGLVNINSAGEAELTTLPGIGESRAKDIIAYREENGGFSKIEDIMNVSGIKEASFDKIKELICV